MADADFYSDDGELYTSRDIEDRGGSNSNSKANTNVGTSNKGFRKGLQQLTGETGKGKDAHHVFPQKYGPEFSELGIDNQNPIFGAWWESPTHQQSSYQYNMWWGAFFSIPGVTASDAYALARFLAELFGFEIHF